MTPASPIPPCPRFLVRWGRRWLDGRRRRPARVRSIVVSLVVAVLWAWGGAPPARAYVRTRTPDTFVPFFWSDPRNVLEVARPPAGLGVSDSDLRGAAQAALSSWSFPAISCTGVGLRLSGTSTDSQVAARDGRNRIIMRTGAWCRDPVGLTHCHDPSQVALTTVFSRANPGASDDGEILEADIEVNATGDFRWGIIPDGPISGRDYADIYDLASVLTHETGHFIGLDHNCLVPNAPLLLDDHGAAIPSCSAVPDNLLSFINDATMYPFMSTTDIKLRTLSDDELRAACQIYPVGSPPLYQWEGGGGCSLAPSGNGVPAPALFTILFGVAAAVSVARRAGPSGARRLGQRARKSAQRPSI